MSIEPKTPAEEALAAGHKAAAEGVALVEAAIAAHGLKPRHGAGPLEMAWRRGELSKGLLPRPRADLIPTILGMIEFIVDHERRGLPVATALALMKLREAYDVIDPAELAEDERSWRLFVTRHLPFSYDRTVELLGTVANMGGLLRCSKCGTELRCACGCGAFYRPVQPAWTKPDDERSAFEKAIDALTAEPGHSDRFIAKTFGIARSTVARARQSLVESGSKESAT